MAIIGTFNDASIIALPSRPGLKQIEMVANDAVAVSSSPYTGTQQVQWWPGGDWWTASFAPPQMTPANMAVWQAFMLELRGMKNVFQLGHPQRRTPQGQAKGVPLVNGAHAAMATTLNTKDWVANVARQLLPGDHLQLGYHLHAVLNVPGSDASGNALISLWPGLREPLVDGAPIILHNPRGLFRLAENKRSVTSNETRLSAVQTIKCMEAR